MKILVLSDIHANIWALQEVIEKEKAYDRLCFAGDMVDYGIAPSQVIEYLRNVPNALLVQGNHDLHAVKVSQQEDFKICLRNYISGFIIIWNGWIENR